jgi:hypothetical protein
MNDTWRFITVVVLLVVVGALLPLVADAAGVLVRLAATGASTWA